MSSNVLTGEIERFTDEVDDEIRRRVGINLSRKMTYCLLATIVVIVLSIGLGIGFAVDEEDKNKKTKHHSSVKESSPDDHQIKNPPPRMESLLALIEPLAGTSVRSVGTPQYKAIDWMVNVDPLQLDFESRNLDVVLDRYVMVTFYFATGGENWTDKYNFMSKKNVCLWNVPGAAPGDQPRGIKCNDDNEIVSIHLEGNNLDGMIPPDLALIQPLKMLSLGENNLRYVSSRYSIPTTSPPHLLTTTRHVVVVVSTNTQ